MTNIEGTVIKLEPEDAQLYALIGTTIGLNFAHCLTLAVAHAPDFTKRVKGYTLRALHESDNEFSVLKNEALVPELYIVVSFYEDPPIAD